MTTASARHRTDDASSPRGLLVVGPHRSGTSATTRVLSLLGANLPDHLMAPRFDDNETGFWESRELVSISDDVIATAGLDWQDVTALPQDFFAGEALQPLRERALRLLRRELGGARLFVLKDPRFCRLLPFWVTTVQELGATPSVILVVRNPLETADSLSQRNKLPLAHALLLWLRYALEAEFHSRGCARALIDFQDLLNDWPAAIGRVAERLSITWPVSTRTARGTIDAFLSQDLRHYRYAPDDLLARADLSPWVQTAFSLLDEGVREGTCEGRLRDGLDQLRRELDHADPFFNLLTARADGQDSRPPPDGGSESPPGPPTEVQIHALGPEPRAAGSMPQMLRSPSEVVSTGAPLAPDTVRIRKLTADLRIQKALTVVASQQLQRAQTLARSLQQGRGSHAQALGTQLSQCSARLAARTAEAQGLTAKLADSARRAAEPCGRMSERIRGWCLRLTRRSAGAPRQADRDIIAASPLFMEPFYRAQAAELTDPGMDAIRHYLERGAAQGLDPHPLFATAYFAAQLPELAETGANPLLHYLVHGARWPVSPHPLFDTVHYLRGNPDVAAAGVSPLVHFLEFGHAPEHLRDPHPLFDTCFYLRQNPDVAEAGFNPLVHFVQFGDAVYHRRNPHPLFDTDYYLRRNPDVAEARMNSLAHFVQFGDAPHHRRRPHPLFDNDYYLREAPEAVEAGINSLVHFLRYRAANPHPLFDCGHYLLHNLDVAEAGANPLLHYLERATSDAAVRNPHALFDTRFYLRSNPDVVEAGVNPLVHFIEAGGGTEEQRNPHPLFDTGYYLSQHPDASPSPPGPLLHFLHHGSKPGFLAAPHPLFEPTYYLASRPELERAAVPALLHFLKSGADTDADPHPLFTSAYYRAQLPQMSLGDAPAVCHYIEHGAELDADPHPLFDTRYYRSQTPEPEQALLNPLIHFLVVGAGSGKDPNPRFSVSYYLRHNPDVAAAGRNPLVHFVEAGARQGRPPCTPFDSERLRRRLAAGAPLTIKLLQECARVEADDDYVREYACHARDLAELRAQRDRPQIPPAPPQMIRIEPEAAVQALAELRIPATTDPVVSILIPVLNELCITVECLSSLVRHTELGRHEIIVVDDCSEPQIGELLSAVKHLRYLRNEVNEGFLRSCRRAADAARGAFLLLLNNDTQVTPGWLDALLQTYQQVEGAGAVGPKLVYPDGLLQEAGAKVQRDGTTRLIGLFDDPAKARYEYARPVDYCSGACLLIKREVYEQIGGLDKSFAPAYYEDVDLCLSVREAGYQIIYNPAATVIHHLSITTNQAPGSYKQERLLRNRQRLVRKWQDTLERLDQVKLICFYLPQYHPIPENDRWWGQGFTEWANVTRAKPNFVGHVQPNLPRDLGFYDLRIPEVMEHQAHLARRYGIYGFCYYAYWFQGRRLLERPLENMLSTGVPDMPFCLAWANENWTRRWDGEDADILIQQEHSVERDTALILDFVEYFHSPRYIRIGGRPLFLVYRATRIPDLEHVTAGWRALCRQQGIGEIYLASIETFELAMADRDPRRFGFDAAVEFPPHNMAAEATLPADIVDSRFRGDLHDYPRWMARSVARSLPGYTRFRGVFPRWDNTPRRQEQATIFLGSSPAAYRAWLESAIDDARMQNFGDERLVFINAWNEWAEGAFLEPDSSHEHEYLQATQDALDRWMLRPDNGE